MSVLSKLASALNRKDEVPNQELAKQLASKADRKAIQELIENLTNKSSAIQSDCIKVLYEIGERKPQLIAEYVKEFVSLLDNKNNRLQWGAMTALSSIASVRPSVLNAALSKILQVADRGSVITKDHAMKILTVLCSDKRYAKNAFALLNEGLLVSATNQLPMYAENALPVITCTTKTLFIKTLIARLGDIEKQSKRKRV